MRLASTFMTVLVLASLALPARAAVVWAENTASGYPVTSWTRGANLSESMANARAYANGPIRILEACRQPGWFAYAGSGQQFQRGVSCGFATRAAALYKARAECRAEGGLCDLERVGYDDGAVAANAFSAAPENLPGGETGQPVVMDMDLAAQPHPDRDGE